jgi:hypothetical protein
MHCLCVERNKGIGHKIFFLILLLKWRFIKLAPDGVRLPDAGDADEAGGGAGAAAEAVQQDLLGAASGFEAVRLEHAVQNGVVIFVAENQCFINILFGNFDNLSARLFWRLCQLFGQKNGYLKGHFNIFLLLFKTKTTLPVSGCLMPSLWWMLRRQDGDKKDNFAKCLWSAYPLLPSSSDASLRSSLAGNLSMCF